MRECEVVLNMIIFKSFFYLFIIIFICYNNKIYFLIFIFNEYKSINKLRIYIRILY